MINEISSELATRMAKNNLSGLVVGLTLKFTNFEQTGKQKKTNKPTSSFEDISLHA
jgi:hypothetical protein